jgi:hypothetical protein
LLKGRFESLRELRIEINNRQQHEFAVMWIRCCIILHNLIILLEGDDCDMEWLEELYQQGMSGGQQHADGGDGNPEEAEAESDAERQEFRATLMNRLFDSPFTMATRRPD